MSEFWTLEIHLTGFLLQDSQNSYNFDKIQSVVGIEISEEII